jgi:type IV secretion system protein VirB9
MMRTPGPRAFAVGLILALCAAPAAADPRIRTVTYSPEKVISVVGHYGYQIAIEFPSDEAIESVAIGDSMSWQATPNKRGDALFIKPVDIGEPTNMTVMTATRHYAFELAARRRTETTPVSEIVYLLKVRLPEEARQPAVALKDPPAIPLAERDDLNRRYTFTGARENLPSRVYDDGRSTTFEWPEGAETPAIFARRPDGGEAIVNYSYAGPTIVVHQVAREFILRNGGAVTRIYNDGFVEVDRGPDAPAPRAEKKRGFLGLFDGS